MTRAQTGRNTPNRRQAEGEAPLAGGRQKALLTGRRRGEENGGHVVFYPEIWYHKNEIITQSDIHRVSDCLSARKPKREKGRLKYGNMEV